MKGCRPLNDSEVAAVLGSFSGKRSKRDKAIFLLGLRAGFRVTEILSLQVEDVLKGGKVVDRITVQRRNMKGKKEGRTVACHPEVKAALIEWLNDSGLRSGPLFRGRKGKQAITRIQAWRILDKQYKKNSIYSNTGTHCMRKTFAVKVHEKLGNDVRKTQKALAHKSILTTMSYLPVDDEEIDSAILSD